MRTCSKCIDAEHKCVKMAVFGFIADCEEGNKKAMERIMKKFQEKSSEPECALLLAIPDAVHVGKSLKCSFSNWFLLFDDRRSSLAVLRTLRENSDHETRSKMRKHIRDQDAVRNKDRMAVEPILELSAEGFTKFLENLGPVVHCLVPEKFRYTLPTPSWHNHQW